MDNRTIQLNRTENGFTIEVRALFAGDDLVISVIGGDEPHVGSVSVAIPRESLRGDGSSSATVSTMNVTGHKDDEVGNVYARELAKHTGHICVVTCGIHVDNLSMAEIDQIVTTSGFLLEDLKATLGTK